MKEKLTRRVFGDNVWLESVDPHLLEIYSRQNIVAFQYEVLNSEDAVGEEMLAELVKTGGEKDGDITLLLLGGRGAQAMYRAIGKRISTGELDELLSRLHVFTQDALAPMRMDNGLSFVRDFERLLGEEFFSRVKSFTPMQTETDNLETELLKYLDRLDKLGGIDLFLLGFGPEAGAASHLAYIKPHSGAVYSDLAGIIPISETILEHHISKFKAGGSPISEADEAETRRAKFILTLGPAAILKAKKVVQSIVDADTAPGKKASFRRLLDTKISAQPDERAAQMNENPGLWLCLHPNRRTLILPNLVN